MDYILLGTLKITSYLQMSHKIITPFWMIMLPHSSADINGNENLYDNEITSASNTTTLQNWQKTLTIRSNSDFDDNDHNDVCHNIIVQLDYLIYVISFTKLSRIQSTLSLLSFSTRARYN